MDRWAGRVALVTGASSGIGAEIARKLVSHGMKVYGCARNFAKLQEISNELKSEKGRMIPVECDVAKEEDILAMFEKIKQESGSVDVLVNSAGIAHVSTLLEGKTEDFRHMLDVNVLGLTICTREAVKQMKERKVDDGHIFQIGSMSGHRIVPGSSHVHFYSATKYAVKGLVDGLRNELRQMKSNIRVTHISPGLVHTEFAGRMLNDMQKGDEICTKFKSLEANDIADSVIYALSAPYHVQVHDILIRPTECDF